MATIRLRSHVSHCIDVVLSKEIEKTIDIVI